MILRIILRGNLVTYAACHRHSTQTCCANQRINLLLAEHIEQLHKEDTARNRKCKCEETTHNDTNSCPVQECFTRHGSTYTQPQEDGCRIHDTIGSRIKQTACIRTDFFNQVTEHQHTNQRHCRRHKKGDNRSHCYREDDFQYTQVLYFSFRGVEFFLFLHVNHQFLLRTE